MKINKMEIWAWLKKQDYETEYMSYNDNSEFKMYYELDMPDILHAYYEWKKAEEKKYNEMDTHLRTKTGIGGL